MNKINAKSIKNIPLEKVVCFCFNLTYGDVSKCIEENNIKTFEELTELTKITKACNACKQDVLELFRVCKKS